MNECVTDRHQYPDDKMTPWNAIFLNISGCARSFAMCSSAPAPSATLADKTQIAMADKAIRMISRGVGPDPAGAGTAGSLVVKLGNGIHSVGPSSRRQVYNSLTGRGIQGPPRYALRIAARRLQLRALNWTVASCGALSRKLKTSASHRHSSTSLPPGAGAAAQGDARSRRPLSRYIKSLPPDRMYLADSAPASHSPQ